MNTTDTWGPDAHATEERLRGAGATPLLVSGVMWSRARCPLCGREHRVEVRPLVEGDHRGQLVFCERMGEARRVDLWILSDMSVEVVLAGGSA